MSLYTKTVGDETLEASVVVRSKVEGSAADEVKVPVPARPATQSVWPLRSTVTPCGTVTTPSARQSVSASSVMLFAMVVSAYDGKTIAATHIAAASAAYRVF